MTSPWRAGDAADLEMAERDRLDLLLFLRHRWPEANTDPDQFAAMHSALMSATVATIEFMAPKKRRPFAKWLGKRIVKHQKKMFRR